MFSYFWQCWHRDVIHACGPSEAAEVSHGPLAANSIDISLLYTHRDHHFSRHWTPTRGCRIPKMSLSRQSLSPTANLLRNSRLFSLPNPLPRPPVSETYGAGISKASDTATLPYPTHQAIATTKSSLARGDWGLKRPIPSRSHIVQTSDPVLRITQLDTIEHVTDFDSAADHVRTRQKWEEMGMPMMKSTNHHLEPLRSGMILRVTIPRWD